MMKLIVTFLNFVNVAKNEGIPAGRLLWLTFSRNVTRGGNAYKLLVKICEGKRSIARPILDGGVIKMNVKVRCNEGEWIHWGQERDTRRPALSGIYFIFRGTRWRSWFRHLATSQKIAGSIPDCVIGIFHWHNPSSRTRALGSTQPLTEMSTRCISWG